MGKEEIACHEQFLLFPQCFQRACCPGASKGVIVWEWVNLPFWDTKNIMIVLLPNISGKYSIYIYFCDSILKYIFIFFVFETEKCQQYGDKGADMRMCASEGGNVGCSECDRYFNIKKDYCPVMCGLCDRE